jgi:hypothetical protein
MLQKIEEIREARRQKLEDQRHTQEFEALQECTFAPRINKPKKSKTRPSQHVHPPTQTVSPPSDTEVVIVRGLSRFLELKELAKRQEEERRYIMYHQMIVREKKDVDYLPFLRMIEKIISCPTKKWSSATMLAMYTYICICI